MKPLPLLTQRTIQLGTHKPHKPYRPIFKPLFNPDKKLPQSANTHNFTTNPRIQTKQSHSIISAYAANTNQGIIRDYNEDRVTIILNFTQPKQKDVSYWPKCAFFGLYDGHGGSNCADFLRDSLHHYV